MKPANNQNFEAEVVFDRTNATYKPEQTVTGCIRLHHKSGSTFKADIASITITPTGKLALHPRHNNKKVEEFSTGIKQINFMESTPLELAKNKTMTQTSAITFRFKLSKNEHRYIETYFGVYISVAFEIQLVVKFLNNYGVIVENVPFYVQVPKQGRQVIENFVYPKKKNFLIVSDEIKGDKIPKFRIKGELESEICYFTEDLNGSITIEQAEAPIRSIDVQMYRIEKLTSSTGELLTQKTEIQMIQMCDGDVTRKMQLPIYMILPRYYACPSFKYQWAQVDFEIDLVIIFKNGFKVTVNIPLKLIRS